MNHRQLDILIAEKVLGFEVRRIKTLWYKYDIVLFFAKGHPHVVYSYDENSCNAIMFANGIDESDGVAQALPHYSTEIQAAWEVCDRMKDHEYFGMGLETIVKSGAEDAARRICGEALRAVKYQQEADALTADQRELNASKNVMGD